MTLRQTVPPILALAVALFVAPAAPGAATDPSDFSIGEIAAIDLVNGYINDIRTIQGNFVQTAPDGEVTEGRFFLERPGKLKFEYAAPSELSVTSDGSWVAVQDRARDTDDRYPLRSTPLNLVLSQEIDLMQDARILDVNADDELISVTLEDPSGEAAGTLKLYFDPVDNRLRRWIVTDAQGLDTEVAFRDVVHGEPIDERHFRILSFRVLEDEEIYR